jgi:hypothetical protein
MSLYNRMTEAIKENIEKFDKLLTLVPLYQMTDKRELDRERNEFIADITVKEEKKEKLKQMIDDLKDVNEGDFFSFENDGTIITSKDNTQAKTQAETQAETQEIQKLERKTWSFGKVHNIDETEAAKTIKNAFFAKSIIKTNKEKVAIPIIKNEKSPDVIALEKQIKCIECSIKKLELNLKLTNEDGIKDDEFLKLLTEISRFCGTETGEMDCDTDLQDFVNEAILKRDMNSIAGLIKMASFMCPILAFANKSLYSDLAASGAAAIPENTDQNTVGICSKIIGYITRSGNEGLLTIDDTATEIDFLDKVHDNGVIEAIVSFVGIGSANKNRSIEEQIKGSIRSVVRRTINNTIKTVFETATFYQKTICMVFITLLSTHIYLTLCMNNVKDTEAYYKSYIEYAYDNMTNTTMKIDFGNKSILNTTGGKKASKSRRAAKPRATRAAKAVSKAIAKAAAAKPKAAANATKPTTKPTKANAKPTKANAKPTNAKPVANATAKPTKAATTAPKKKK